VTGQVTPMEYGLGAQTEPAPGALSFQQAKAHIFEAERRNNARAGHPQPLSPPQ
jgi:copper chaperone NosL